MGVLLGKIRRFEVASIAQSFCDSPNLEIACFINIFFVFTLICVFYNLPCILCNFGILKNAFLMSYFRWFLSTVLKQALMNICFMKQKENLRKNGF